MELLGVYNLLEFYLFVGDFHHEFSVAWKMFEKQVLRFLCPLRIGKRQYLAGGCDISGLGYGHDTGILLICQQEYPPFLSGFIHVKLYK